MGESCNTCKGFRGVCYSCYIGFDEGHEDLWEPVYTNSKLFKESLDFQALRCEESS